MTDNIEVIDLIETKVKCACKRVTVITIGEDELKSILTTELESSTNHQVDTCMVYYNNLHRRGRMKVYATK
jgi:FtsZ-binding cell division protein ZapB